VWSKNIRATPCKKKFKTSIGFFSLQGNPSLLVPWMVYTIAFLIVNTILFIFYAVEYFTINDAENGAASIVAAVIYLCK